MSSQLLCMRLEQMRVGSRAFWGPWLCHCVSVPVGGSSQLDFLHPGVWRAEWESLNPFHLQGICWWVSGYSTESIFSFCPCTQERHELHAALRSVLLLLSQLCVQTGCIGSTVSVFCGSYSSFKCPHLLFFMLLVFSSAAGPEQKLPSSLFAEGLIDWDLFPLVSQYVEFHMNQNQTCLLIW